MNYRFMIDIAVDAIRKRYDKRHNPVPGDTVCVICAGNGNIYTGLNKYVTSENVSQNVHAEISAVKQMLDDGQTKIKAMIVYNACSVSPLLPCNGCIQYILSLNPENTNTIVVTPDGNILITDVSKFASGTECQTRRSDSGFCSVYTSIPETTRGASLYTNASGTFMPSGSSSAVSQVSVTNPGSGFNGTVPVRANQKGVNNILKNKLNSILKDE
ncbi:MAG: hypothetical protein ACI4KB_00290 [Oscillospiraceae bacterium]|nr:hypothetical protein [Oscillospiraceae bacterium]